MAHDGPVRVSFGGLTTAEFLERHWQREPLLVRGAISSTSAGPSRAELFELASSERVPSRWVAAPRADVGWRMDRGPFASGDLEASPDDGWTLLIQEADRHVTSCSELLQAFRFVPNWRLDDVMVSYATDGGGIGPHVDRYDVFLVQTEGRRRWRIAEPRPGRAALRTDTELPILAEFRHDREWVLEPGDMLYLPPGVPHEGVALGECVTCSVGCRVPDPRELCSGFLRELGPAAYDAIRYEDPGLRESDAPGEIPQAVVEELRGKARALFDGPGFQRWVGRFLTAPLRGSGPDGTAETIDALWSRLEAGAVLRRSAPSHFAWSRGADGSVALFVGGERYPLAADCTEEAEVLCGRVHLDLAALRPLLGRPDLAAIVLDLIRRGHLA
jgi:50S ribosomal protein L16 3-hydroxylase